MERTISVLGMGCANCKAKVEVATSSVEGVASARVDLEAGTLTYTYEGVDPVTDVRTTIKEIGYEPA